MSCVQHYQLLATGARLCGSWLMSQQWSQSSPEPQRVHKHHCHWLSPWQTGSGFCRKFRYHTLPRHLLTSYTSSVFSDGGVSQEDMSWVRRVSVAWSWSPDIKTITMARSSSAVTRPGARSGPLPPLRVSPFTLIEETLGGGERPIYHHDVYHPPIKR